mmetsp:Transcript_45/g.143  ORF Transcript_45/g.143 Transcript_45/m.143 type:complete len:220 (+) Transcript_45:813-1472(+)
MRLAASTPLAAARNDLFLPGVDPSGTTELLRVRVPSTSLGSAGSSSGRMSAELRRTLRLYWLIVARPLLLSRSAISGKCCSTARNSSLVMVKSSQKVMARTFAMRIGLPNRHPSPTRLPKPMVANTVVRSALSTSSCPPPTKLASCPTSPALYTISPGSATMRLSLSTRDVSSDSSHPKKRGTCFTASPYRLMATSALRLLGSDRSASSRSNPPLSAHW